VVGYREHLFLRTTYHPDRFYCGMHGGRVDWPTSHEPVWRGEVPAGAECDVCGIALEDLE
jgi:hypothetical protein